MQSLSRRRAMLEERSQPSLERQCKLDAQLQSELPYWPDSVRRVPNVALRSALFAAIGKGPRPSLTQVEIHAQGGISILYTGAQLDQGDLDVWEAVLHIARSQELGSECRVTAYRILKELCRTDTGPNRKILDNYLSRIKAASLEVRAGAHSYEGSLIHELYRDYVTRSYVFRLNPKLRPLFVGDQFTDLDWSVRQSLHGKPLAQWLHGYYASHAKPYPLKVETLHRLCGSRARSLSDFKKDLRRSLDSVEEASNATGCLFNYAIEGDLVRVKTTPSASQQRHLSNRRAVTAPA